MLQALLPLYWRPAQQAATMPETRLGAKNVPRKNPIVPPKAADKTPMYGPRSMPIIGTVIAEAVMLLLGTPRI